MAEFTVKFDNIPASVIVEAGALISDAAKIAGINILQPCGGQGRCGRCAVRVLSGSVHFRSTLRLSDEDVANGYALACQTVIGGNVLIEVPQQEKIERRLVTDRTAIEVSVPSQYDPYNDQSIQKLLLTLAEPNLEDQTDDLNRLRIAIKQVTGLSKISIPLSAIIKIGRVLREGNWKTTVILDIHFNHEDNSEEAWLIDIFPGHPLDEMPILGLAIDIGTTTVTVWLVDLFSGKILSQASLYNQQISRGEDVISRIIYASKNGGTVELQDLVITTINDLIETVCSDKNDQSYKNENIYTPTIAGNSTMIHLLLGLSASTIRFSPYITTLNQVPMLRASQLGLSINPSAVVDCLPGVASYVGADISAGVYSSGMDHTDMLTLFLDVGTNGEIVLGSQEWLVTCACSAGPAFEGAGVASGMRATSGAIEEIWINTKTYEPTYRVIGGGKPRGLCGSGLINLLAELFMTGVIDKGGNINSHLDSPRIREGKHGLEYVVVWATESQNNQDIVLTRVDIDNLLRVKAAIYAGFSVSPDSVGVRLADTEQIFIGGSFGKYLNVEKAIQIGLLPDLSWDRFRFLGNTAVLGTYYALLDRNAHKHIQDIASRMTYIELSADNNFYEAFVSALFLPHTDLDRFPNIAQVLDIQKGDD